MKNTRSESKHRGSFEGDESEARRALSLRTALRDCGGIAAKPDKQWNRKTAEYGEKKTAVDAWIGRMRQCYRDVYSRADEQWRRELLEDRSGGLDTVAGSQEEESFWLS